MEKKSLYKEIQDWLVAIVIAAVLAFVIRTFIVEPYLVDGPSMRPTLYTDERLIVNKFTYWFHSPERGDVIVFKFPSDQKKDFIKRVIAIPGDTIEIKDGHVILNGQILKELYILNDPIQGTYSQATVPAGHVFAMGDNRNNSEDSRYKEVGFVPYELIKGKALFIFWPFDKFKSLT